MPKDDEIGAGTTAEMVVHVARLANGEGYACGLTAAQWTALRFFARANRFSRTVSAFADYHATTRGTASQTVKSLVTHDLLKRTKSSSDGRSARLDLTEKGRALLAEDPFADLVRAIDGLPKGQQKRLVTALERIMGRIARERGKRPFGTCPTCRHLQHCLYEDQNVAGFFCAFVDKPLAPAELEEICIDYERGEPAPPRRMPTPSEA